MDADDRREELKSLFRCCCDQCLLFELLSSIADADADADAVAADQSSAVVAAIDRLLALALRGGGSLIDAALAMIDQQTIDRSI